MLSLRNRFGTMIALAMAAGFAAPMNALGRIDRQSGHRTGWRKPRNLIKRMPSEAFLEQSAKRTEMRRAKVRRAVVAGGYGCRPYVGQQGYIGYNPNSAADRLTLIANLRRTEAA